MPWIHESSKICFFFSIWHRDWARPWRPWRPWLSEAINVMSMIRAAGRAGDVPKALELLRQLELSEKCLWPSEHIGTQNETQNEPILSPFWVHSHHLYIRFMTLILLWFILVLLLLNLMWRRCNCCQGRSILRPTIVHLRPHVFFFPKDWRVLGPVPIHGDFQPGLCGRRRPPQCRHVAAANGQGGACGCGLVQYAQCLEFWGWFQSQEWIESWPIFAEVHKTTSARTPAQRGSQNLAGAPQHGVEICWDCHHFAFRLYFADFAAYFQKWLCFPLE